MKKFVSALIAAAMVATMSVATLAATPSTPITSPSTGNGEGNYGIGVTGNYTPGSTGNAAVISADIAWDEMTFTYKDYTAGSWNPSTHTYSDTHYGGWISEAKAITITNHSNIQIVASASFESAADHNAVGGFFRDAYMTAAGGEFEETEALDTVSVILMGALGTTYDTAPTEKIHFTVKTSTRRPTSAVSLGTITVLINTVDRFASTKEELIAATENGGRIALSANIDMGTDTLTLSKNTTIDFRNFYVTGSGNSTISIGQNAEINLQSGTVKNTSSSGCAVYNAGILDAYNISISNTNSGTAVKTENTAKINSCTVTSTGGAAILMDNSNEEMARKLAIMGYTTIDGAIQITPESSLIKPTVTEGTYNFDPTEYVDTSAFLVTESEGTWTVTSLS